MNGSSVEGKEPHGVSGRRALADPKHNSPIGTWGTLARSRSDCGGVIPSAPAVETLRRLVRDEVEKTMASA
jgi:hypothetical protein